MKAIYIIVFITLSPLIYAQNNDRDENRLSQEAYDLKYLKQMSVKNVINVYRESESLNEKLIILKVLSDSMKDKRVLNTFIEAIYESLEPKKEASYWKLRVSAIYWLGEKGNQLSDEERLEIIKIMVSRFQKDINHYVVAESAYGLAKLVTDHRKIKSSHKLFNKGSITNLFSRRLLQLKSDDNYLCLQLVLAFRRLDDPECVSILKEMRKRAYLPVVLTAIDQTLKKWK